MSLIQGETYEESSSAEVAYMGDQEPKDKRPFNKKVIYIAVIAVVLLLFIVIAYTLGSSGNNTTAPEEDDMFVDMSGENFFVEEFEPVVIFTYTDEEIAALREVGYTGDEIEEFQSQALPAEDKILEAEAVIEAKQKEILQKLSDTASPEYLALLEMTWAGGKNFILEALPTDGEVWDIEDCTLNADYVKVPTQGNQLWIRVEMADGTYTFMETTPDRYVKLKDFGNILVTYRQITYNGVTVICNMKEVITGG